MQFGRLLHVGWYAGATVWMLCDRANHDGDSNTVPFPALASRFIVFFLDAVHRFYCPRKEVGARSYYDLGTNAPIQRYVCAHDVQLQRCDATSCSPALGLVVEVRLLV
jgi:hypothetical protein